MAIATGGVVAALATVSGTPWSLAILLGIPAAALTWTYLYGVHDGPLDFGHWSKRTRIVGAISVLVIMPPVFFAPIESSLELLFLLTGWAVYFLGVLVGTLSQIDADDPSRGDQRLHTVTPGPRSD